MGVLVEFKRKGGTHDMSAMPKRRTQQKNLNEIVQKNVDYFYTRDWKQTDKQGKSVYNIAKGISKPSLRTLELVAEKAKVPVWYLLLDAPDDALASHELENFVNTFLSLSPEQRNAITQIAVGLMK